MIDHTGFNVTDYELSRDYYVKVLAPLGYGISLELENACGFGTQEGGGDDPGGDFWIGAGEPQTPRSHIAFRATSEEQVKEFHRAAIEAGGTDNGPPGERPHYHPGYYAAFVRDPDGYKIEAVYHGAGSNTEA
jgi:catechol 2,3-dioxygenase-like lactoylglutathione lyase family enzyme